MGDEITMLNRLSAISSSEIVDIDMLLKTAIGLDCTDIHIMNSNVSFRLEGRLIFQPMSINAKEIFNGTSRNQDKQKQKEDLYVTYAFTRLNRRFRATFARAYGQEDGTLTIRILTDKAPKIKETILANYPGFIESIKEEKSGITLVAGAVASGKSTTCASLISYIAPFKPKSYTLEDPVEFIFEPITEENQIVQREIGEDVKSYEKGVISILTENPDMIFIGETKTKEVAFQALQAAMSGATVITTFHATGVKEAKARFISLMPEEYKNDAEIYIKNILWQDMFYEEGRRKFISDAMIAERKENRGIDIKRFDLLKGDSKIKLSTVEDIINGI